jgi:hypothetical protein
MAAAVPDAMVDALAAAHRLAHVRARLAQMSRLSIMSSPIRQVSA